MPPRLAEMRDDLLKAARKGSTITYGELMRRHNLSRGRPLTAAIGAVDRPELARGAPGFAAIIVRKDTGFPGGGYFCDDELPPSLRRSRGRSTDPKLSSAEKDYIIKQQKKIWSFYRKTRP